MKYAYFALLAAMTGLAGCATQSSLDVVRSDVDAVKTRLFSVEKDLGGVRDESKQGIGSIEKEYKSDVTAVRKLSADIQASMDSLRTEIQALNGKADDLAIATKKPTDDLTRYREDADKRMLTLEDRVMKLQTAIDELGKKMGDLASLPKKEEVVTPESFYTKGLELFKAGDMPGARDIFTKFLDKYPQHDLAANAQYWIGETFYSEKGYEPAILAYQEVIKQYPTKDKVPAAMLKQAMSFKAIKDAKSARYVLKKLVEGYPKSDEAKKAKELLKEIK
ncbi:tol-pal system protein YbgF [Oryzomonas japonica]|uniref:Tol-pal system protein YbgF n=1 Tax=Oryzomonas japonica TaxID=2603858 RepID=A0A7J4ZQ77_9BACT|nr:tol-pal system protein YbgF [Oryzomonas japonica]KAB0665152.1 tol-pal system protein YbgF [Oryzomonas japonica]